MPSGVYPRTKEHNKHISESLKGRPFSGTPFRFTGRKHTDAAKKKMKTKRVGRRPALGMEHSEEYKRKMSKRVKKEWKLGLRKGHGHPISDEQKEFLSRTRRGNKNPAWIDGRSALAHQIRRCYKSRQWRSDVFTRDNFTCQECGKRGCYFEAHHIKEFAKILEEYQVKTFEQAMECEELWNINNGLTLCRKCHDKTKWK